ncbi:MAG: Glu/Leu/Phe/Val dehydrogenase dimerization domain-containing protein [Alphaproteobacteria bacterium]
MPVFSARDFNDHEQIVFCHDAESGLKAIIAIHNTARGPALGGCRMWNYDSEQEALTDALRLSRGMTYKSALAGLPYGGGKAVIIGDPGRDKSEALWLAFGRFLDSLGGRYITAEDVGTRPADLEIVRRATPYVAGIAEGGAGDPSPATAHGVFLGIRAAVNARLDRKEIDGLRIAVQGLGNVGYTLAERLAEAGAELFVSDIDELAVARAVRHLGASAVKPDDIYRLEVDVFAPCALGAVINDQTIDQLRVSVVAGSANNQLAEERHGRILHQRNILYAPDYAINAGGVIWVSHEGPAFDAVAALAHVARIEVTLAEIFARARKEGVPPEAAADLVAEDRFHHPAEQAA